jgi:hypothetical protein
LKKDVVIESPDLTLKFEYAWKNHQQHLVKPLSLDLATEEGIQEKAARNYGYLALMNQTAQEHNYAFDILISRPSAKSLYPSYEKALRVLESVRLQRKLSRKPRLNNILMKLFSRLFWLNSKIAPSIVSYLGLTFYTLKRYNLCRF